MFKKILILCLVFSYSAFGYNYRHPEANRVGSGSYYFGIGLLVPFKNEGSDLSKFKLDIPTNVAVGSVIEVNQIEYKTGSLTFHSSNMSAIAFVGYKFPYFLRTDFKADFTTFAHNYPVTCDGTCVGISNFVETRKLAFTIRQLSLIGSGYFDLDNRTPFTPYVGIGGGISFTEAVFILSKLKPDSNGYEEPDSSLFDKVYLTYEFKTGVTIGSRKMFADIEYNIKHTPAIKLVSHSVGIKFAFRI